MGLSEVTTATVHALQDSLRKVPAGAPIDRVAQQAASDLYEMYEKELVLVRVYATVPYSSLPPMNRRFADELTAAKGVAHLLRSDTEVLSLMGTRGREQAWNDRRQSKGHVAIPLVSAQFVDSIPMLARLFQELGLKLDWFDSTIGAAQSIMKGGLSGVFYVDRAATFLDGRGRHVIPAQDFVRKHQIESVFGMGGTYLGGTVLSYIAFANQVVPKAAANRLTPLANAFKAITTKAVLDGNFFER